MEEIGLHQQGILQKLDLMDREFEVILKVVFDIDIIAYGPKGSDNDNTTTFFRTLGLGACPPIQS